MRRAWIGWIAAATALVAIMMVVVDIIHTQAGRNAETATPVTTTAEAARSTGASVTPTDPRQAPAAK